MLLLTGATGNVGRELSRELAAQDVPFRVLVRDLDRAATLPPRAERFVGDLADPATLRPAFKGVTRLFLLVPGVGLDHTRHALAAATAGGVQHIVLLSSFNVLGDPIPAMGRWHHEREQMIRASGIPATMLYALTGNETFTTAEQVAVLAKVIDRTIEVREVATPADVVRSRYPNGAPPALAAAIVDALTQAQADTTGFRTTTVNELLGRPPGTFEYWCARNAAAFQQ